jgi:hypothetical protein
MCFLRKFRLLLDLIPGRIQNGAMARRLAWNPGLKVVALPSRAKGALIPATRIARRT